MASRRDFLQLGIVASALPLAFKNIRAQASPATSTSAPVAAEESRARSFYKVIVDQRIPESVRFGQRLQELGASVHGITGDITEFWFRELHAQWMKQPVAIAGMTQHGPLFCLERLSWDHRMRVVYRAEHTLSDDCVRHEITGPERLLGGAGGLVTSGPEWASHAADLVSGCHDGRSRAATASVVTRDGVPPAAGRDPLFSWVIAPVTQV